MSISTGPQEKEDGCIQRSCRRLTSKSRTLVATEGHPACLCLTAGQVADCMKAEALIDSLGEGNILLAEKGYDSDVICARAKQGKAWATIQLKANRKVIFAFSAWLYRQRDIVERFFNRIKRCRGIATRYDKHPDNYLADHKFIAARIGC